MSLLVTSEGITDYSKTRSTYESYRKAGYSKKFFEEHREEITIHKAAKKVFDGQPDRKIPKVKELSAEYAEVLSRKKTAYQEYRAARDEMKKYDRSEECGHAFGQRKRFGTKRAAIT